MCVWVILHVSLSRLAIDEDDTCSRVPRIAPSDASVTPGSELNSGVIQAMQVPATAPYRSLCGGRQVSAYTVEYATVCIRNSAAGK